MSWLSSSLGYSQALNYSLNTCIKGTFWKSYLKTSLTFPSFQVIDHTSFFLVSVPTPTNLPQNFTHCFPCPWLNYFSQVFPLYWIIYTYLLTFFLPFTDSWTLSIVTENMNLGSQSLRYHGMSVKKDCKPVSKASINLSTFNFHVDVYSIQSQPCLNTN